MQLSDLILTPGKESYCDSCFPDEGTGFKSSRKLGVYLSYRETLSSDHKAWGYDPVLRTWRHMALTPENSPAPGLRQGPLA